MNLFITLGFILVLFQQTLQEELKNLKLVTSLFRHGARGPLYHNLNADSEFNDFYWGQLTPTGQRQHYVLGQTLRERYIDNSDLGLQPIYNHSQIYIRSTDVNRTINSAISQLSGLYPAGTGPWLPEDLSEFLQVPPFQDIVDKNVGQTSLPYNFQNIPVHNVPKPEDYLLSPTNSVTCPQASIYQLKFIESEQGKQIIEEVNKRYEKVMGQFTELFGIQPPMTFNNIVEQYWDTLIADQFNGQHFEGYSQIDGEMWAGLQELDSLWWTTYQSGSEDFVKIGSSRVLQSWIQFSEVKLGMVQKEEYEHLKYVMYSAHDDNVVNMQMALGLMNYECLWEKYTTQTFNQPECLNRAYYASQVIYELYQDGEGYDDAYVKFLFDGEYVVVCNSGGINCPYLEFKQMVADYIYEDGKYNGWFEGDLIVDNICYSDQDLQVLQQLQSGSYIEIVESNIQTHGLEIAVWLAIIFVLSIILIQIVRKYTFIQKKVKNDKKGFQQLDNEGLVTV